MAKDTKKKADKKKKKKGNAGKILGLFLALAIAAGYFFKDCLPNLGLGSGLDTGTATTEKPAEETPPPETTQPAGEQATAVTVVVKGENCVVAGQPEAPCPKVCEDIKAAQPKETRVKLDAALGAHGVVENLKTCLGDGGFADVTLGAE